MRITDYRHWENTTPGHNKYYEARISEDDSGAVTFSIRYGAIGNSSSWKMQACKNMAKAVGLMIKCDSDRRAHGYTPYVDLTPKTPPPPKPNLAKPKFLQSVAYDVVYIDRDVAEALVDDPAWGLSILPDAYEEAIFDAQTGGYANQTQSVTTRGFWEADEKPLRYEFIVDVGQSRFILRDMLVRNGRNIHHWPAEMRWVAMHRDFPGKAAQIKGLWTFDGKTETFKDLLRPSAAAAGIEFVDLYGEMATSSPKFKRMIYLREEE